MRAGECHSMPTFLIACNHSNDENTQLSPGSRCVRSCRTAILEAAPQVVDRNRATPPTLWLEKRTSFSFQAMIIAWKEQDIGTVAHANSAGTFTLYRTEDMHNL